MSAHAEVAFYTSHKDGEFSRSEKGNPVVKGVRVFRVGTFRDSAGRQHTYDHEHLDQVAKNFNALRTNGRFPNVPVREDHTEFVRDVIGYFTDLRRDGDFLLADIEFTEPTAYDRWQRGTYRGRSLEVGSYTDNDENRHFPVALGLAMVDMPAVEMLYSLHRQGEPQEPTTMTQPSDVAPPKPATFRIKGVSTSDADAIQSYIDDLEKRPEKLPDPVPPAKFRISGLETEDQAAVQKHIEVLETFQANVAEGERADFVKALAKDNKLAASAVDQTTEFVKTLNAEQFAAYRKSFEDAPATPQHFGGTPAASAPATPATTETDEVEVLEGVVAQFRRAGMSDEKIAELPASKRLKELQAAAK